MGWVEDLLTTEAGGFVLLLVLLAAGSAAFRWVARARRRARTGWDDTGRHLVHRWRAQRRGVQMEPWQRRTGRHDSWS